MGKRLPHFCSWFSGEQFASGSIEKSDCVLRKSTGIPDSPDELARTPQHLSRGKRSDEYNVRINSELAIKVKEYFESVETKDAILKEKWNPFDEPIYLKMTHRHFR